MHVRTKLVALVSSIACVAGAPAAHADDWRPVQQSCISFDGSGGQCGLARSGQLLSRVLVAPGGTTAYVMSGTVFFGSPNALLIYDRDPATGKLTQREGKAGCISQDGTGGQCDVNRLVGGFGGAMAISPDGKQLYALGGGGVVVFDILAGGALLAKPGKDGCITNDGSDFNTPGVCTDARGMQGPLGDLQLSPGGKTLYVSGTQLAVFDRNATTGVLTQLPATTGCSAPGGVDGCHDVLGFSQGNQISVAPDERSLYVAGGGGGVAIFSRTLATGALTQLPGKAGCITFNGSGNQCATDARLADPRAALTSPDNRQVYVSTQDGVITYARAGDGSLSFQSCVNDRGTAGCRAGVQMINLSFSAISPDGRDFVVATSAGGSAQLSFPGGIVVLSRDPATGDLTQRASLDSCVTNDGSAFDDGQLTGNRCLAVPLAAGPGRITFTSDAQFYAGGSFGTALITYKRDFYPSCANGTASVPHDAATPLQLGCSDRNGDPVAVQVSANPLSGTLGGIDQASQRVTYLPFSGFAGPDRFRYKALAAGLSSPDATFDLSVAAAAPLGGGGNAGGGNARWWRRWRVARDRDRRRPRRLLLRPGLQRPRRRDPSRRTRGPRKPRGRELRRPGRGAPHALRGRRHPLARRRQALHADRAPDLHDATRGQVRDPLHGQALSVRPSLALGQGPPRCHQRPAVAAAQGALLRQADDRGAGQRPGFQHQGRAAEAARGAHPHHHRTVPAAGRDATAAQLLVSTAAASPRPVADRAAAGRGRRRS